MTPEPAERQWPPGRPDAHAGWRAGLEWMGARGNDGGTRSFLSTDPLPPMLGAGWQPLCVCRQQPGGQIVGAGLIAFGGV